MPIPKLPILAISPSPRRVGIACLDRCLQPVYVGSVFLRRRGGEDDRTSLLAERLERLVRQFDVDTVVLEDAPPGASVRRAPVLDLVRRVSSAAEVPLISRSFAVASVRISDGTLTGVVGALARRFPDVAERFGSAPLRIVRSPAWKEYRPKVVAMTIALAAGLDAFIG